MPSRTCQLPRLLPLLFALCFFITYFWVHIRNLPNFKPCSGSQCTENEMNENVNKMCFTAYTPDIIHINCAHRTRLPLRLYITIIVLKATPFRTSVQVNGHETRRL